jgi:hypothetical protein
MASTLEALTAICPTFNTPSVTSADCAPMVSSTLLLPPAFFAVTVTLEGASGPDTVPEITPVELLKDNPTGSPALIDQLATVPPLLVGVSVTGDWAVIEKFVAP